MSTQSLSSVHVDVDVDEDRMRAWLRATGEEQFAEDAEAQIASGLQSAGIAVDAAVEARIGDFLARCRSEEELPDRFLIAEGTPPIPGKPGEFEPAGSADAERSPDADEDHVDHRNYNFIQTVGRGGIVGTLIAPEPPVPGRDVYGKPVVPDSDDGPEAIALGKNVRRSERDPAVVLADVAGRVVCKDRVVQILELLEIKGDVDYESGNVDASCDVMIQGTVRDLFVVRSAKTITIAGAVEGAEVQAKQDLHVRGGIVGHGTGHAVADGSIAVKFCERANLRAGGDITVGKDAIDSQLYAGGRIVVERGEVLGGGAYAREAMAVGTLGNDAGVATVVIVGAHPWVLKDAHEMELRIASKQKTIDAVRQKAQPLAIDPRRLGPAEQKRLAEVMARVESFEAEVEQDRAQLKEMLAAARAVGDAAIVVNAKVYRGVTLTMGLRVSRFLSDLGGPVRIELRQAGRAAEMVATNTLTGSTTPLDSRLLDPAAVEEAFGHLAIYEAGSPEAR